MNILVQPPLKAKTNTPLYPPLVICFGGSMGDRTLQLFVLDKNGQIDSGAVRGTLQGKAYPRVGRAGSTPEAPRFAVFSDLSFRRNGWFQIAVYIGKETAPGVRSFEATGVVSRMIEVVESDVVRHVPCK